MFTEAKYADDDAKWVADHGRSELRINPDQLRPAWHQCPTCRVVVHEACLFAHMSQHADEFPCLSCRTKYTHESVEQ